ncbi:hypothetical protein Tco_1569859 [Tanacetum coccineum]
MQSPPQNPQKGSYKLKGEHIKKDKGKKAMSLKDAQEVSTESDSDDETTHVPGSMIESSKKKDLKKFDFVTKDGERVHLTKEQISAQKKIKEEAKAKAARHESEMRKEELINLLGPEVVNKEDGTSEIIPEFKASDLHLGEWREVVKAFPNKKANKRLKSSVQYEDHPTGTVLNEPVIEIFFRLYQVPRLDDHARTFSSLLLAEIDKRNLNPLKQMRVIEQLRQ